MTASSAQKPLFSRMKVPGLQATACSARPGLSWGTKAPPSASPAPRATSLARPEPRCVSLALTAPLRPVPGPLSARRVPRVRSCLKLGQAASKSASLAAKGTSTTRRGRLSAGPALVGLRVQARSARNAPLAPRAPTEQRRACRTGHSVRCAPGARLLRSMAPCRPDLSTSSTVRGNREPASATSARREPLPTRRGSPAAPLVQPERTACSLAPSAQSSSSIVTWGTSPTRRAYRAAFPARQGAT